MSDETAQELERIFVVMVCDFLYCMLIAWMWILSTEVHGMPVPYWQLSFFLFGSARLFSFILAKIASKFK